jgi:hypothetical protein
MPGLPLSPRGDGVKDMGKKVNEEAMLEQKAKEEALKNEALEVLLELPEAVPPQRG